MKTKQEIFNAVWQYFIVEGHPKATIIRETDERTICKYRGPVSNCAVGCQLPDEFYKPEIEGFTVYNLFDSYPEIENYFGAENEALLSQLQTAHDSNFDKFRSELALIACEYDLEIPTSSL